MNTRTNRRKLMRLLVHLKKLPVLSCQTHFIARPAGRHRNSRPEKMNDIIRVLTIISTILMPLTFIAGLYGMKFSLSDSLGNMPKLHHFYGYPITFLLMLAIALGMIRLFKETGCKTSRLFECLTFRLKHLLFRSKAILFSASRHLHLTFVFFEKIKSL